MIVLLSPGVDPGPVAATLQGLGLWTRPLRRGDGRVDALAILPGSAAVDLAALRSVAGVRDVLAPTSPHPRVDALAGRPVTVGPATFSPGGPPVLAAGPCAAESEELVHHAAALVASVGGRLLRGGAWKPRTSPYSFRGHGAPALRWLREAADAHGLGVVTEVLSEHDVEEAAAAADLVQVGSRNMQNFALLRAVGATGRPVLLKRGMAASIEDWLLAGEHLLEAGAGAVVFCERGVHGGDPSTRNLLDLGAVALLAHVLRLPVVVDPSHAVGRRDLIAPLAAAAVAAGATGVLVETHPRPAEARSDGPQSLPDDGLRGVARALRAVGAAMRDLNGMQDMKDQKETDG